LDKAPVQSSEVVVTIRQHSSEIGSQDVSLDTEQELLQSKNEENCTQKTQKKRLICQKAKEAAKQKQNRVSGSNHLKSSTIQTPTP